MILKKCDLLSPPITLYFKGDLKHASIFSAVLSIAAKIIEISFALYYIVQFLKKANPKIYSYNRYAEEKDAFPLNSSSMFHYVNIPNTDTHENEEIDFDSIRIIGLQKSIEVYHPDNNLTKYTHWIYGPCNEEDSGNLKQILTNDFPKKSACIRQYFDIETQKYYNTNDPNFQWPYIQKETANKKSTNYGVVVEKCRNDTLRNDCKTSDDINEYLKTKFFAFYFIDQFIDSRNYKNPLIKYSYKLSNGFFEDSFTINHLNFNPVIIKSYKGIFFDEIEIEKSYQFIQNEKIVMNMDDTGIIASSYFWIQNVIIYYERIYDRLQDLLSEIGGFGGSIDICAQLISFFMSEFTILLDTEETVINIDNLNFNSWELNKKATIIRKASELMNPPKIRSKNKKMTNKIIYNKQSSIYQILLKDKVDICKICNEDAKSEILTYKNNLKDKKFFNTKDKNDTNNKKSKNFLNSISLIDLSDNKMGFKNKDYYCKSVADSKNEQVKKSIDKLETNNKEINLKNINKQDFSFFKYIYYFLCCQNNPKIKYYENFRRQIISEENMIQNHFNVYKLLQVCELKNINPFEIKSLDQNICM